MIERKWLGDKTGQGFYKKIGKDREIHALDWKTLEYQLRCRSRAFQRSKPRATSKIWASGCGRCSAPMIAPGSFCGRY